MNTTANISEHAVESALNALRYSSSDTHSFVGLHHLTLVKHIIRSIFLGAEDSLSRDYAVQKLLTTVITEQLTRCRKMVGLPLPKIDRPLAECIKQIQLDVREENPELIGWSFFYHFYVRVDIDITQSDYAEIAHLNTRTLRRYQKNTRKKLALLLVEQEWTARQASHDATLRQQIPTQERFSLVPERKKLLQQILRSVDDHQCQFIFISGETGIGKTQFAGQLAYHILDIIDCDYVFWFRDKPSFKHFLRIVKEKVNLTHIDKNGQWQELLIHYRILVVFDTNTADNFSDKWRLLLSKFHTAYIIATSNNIPNSKAEDFICILNPISIDSTVHLLQSLLIDKNSSDIRKIVMDIWSECAGNPTLTIQRITNQAGEEQSVYQNLSQSLSVESKALWLFLSISRKKALSSREINRIFPNSSNLLETDIVVKTPDGYQVNQIARHYILRTCHDKKVIGALLNSDAHYVDPLWHLCFFLSASPDLVNKVMSEIFADAFEKESFKHEPAQWYYIFQQHAPSYKDNPYFDLARAYCAMQLYDWELAESLLRSCMELFGMGGNFVAQIRAQFELALLWKVQGNLTKAKNRLEILLSRPIINKDQDLYRRMRIEIFFIQSYPTDLPMYVGFDAGNQELEDLNEMLGLAKLELANTHASDASSIFRLKTLIGRIYYKNKNTSESVNWLNSALSTAEANRNIYTIARARTNLAAAIASINSYEAKLLLHQAKEIQQEIYDIIGLNATMHNLSKL